MDANRVRKIEFSGVPGGGKTTLCRELIRQFQLYDPIRLQEEIFDDLPFPDTLSQVIPKAARKLRERAFARVVGRAISEMRDERPELVQTVTRAVEELDLSSEKLKEKLVYWTLRSQALSEIADEMLSGSTIFADDEGSVHRAITLFAGLCETEYDGIFRDQKISAYLEFTPQVDLFVVVDAPNSICVERMKAREKGLPTRLKYSTYAQIEAFLDASREVAQVAADFLIRRGVSVLYIDTAERSRWESVNKIGQARLFDSHAISQSA